MTNQLLVKAITKTETSTISRLYINGHFECYVLEDKDRGMIQQMPLSDLRKLKVDGKTAIPSGTYKVNISFSNRFQKLMPILLEVPAFDGVRIHSGNWATNTEGCLLLGNGIAKDMVTDSRTAFEAFFIKLKNMLKQGEVILTIDRTV